MKQDAPHRRSGSSQHPLGQPAHPRRWPPLWWLATALLGTALCLACRPVRAAANVVIINNDGVGEGLNDTTPATPVGGNPGTTIGQQRLNAFEYAAAIWAAGLESAVDIQVLASFDALSCTATTATLGSAGPISVEANFPGAPWPDTWYPAALANRLAGVDLRPSDPEIRARFNSRLGETGCLTGSGWYYGFDGNAGAKTDLVPVLLHELAHGLGFTQTANLATGALFLGWPDAYNRNLLDLATGKTWDQMSSAERVTSAVSTAGVVWKGPEVTSAVPCVLGATPVLQVNSPEGVAGNYAVGTAAFGPPLSLPGVTADLALANDGSGATADACQTLVNDLSGKIAVVDRGDCTFVIKVKNAQDAGALGVIVVDNVVASTPPPMGGTQPAITIPSASITKSNGDNLKAAMLAGTVNATLALNPELRAGADPLGRARMYTPNPLQSGSSIAHWDTSGFPNQLMEPALNADVSQDVSEPTDLSLALMRDLGWFPGWGYTKYDLDMNGCVDVADYNALIAAIRSGSTDPGIDLNCDGKIDVGDSRTLVLHFSHSGGAACE